MDKEIPAVLLLLIYSATIVLGMVWVRILNYYERKSKGSDHIEPFSGKHSFIMLLLFSIPVVSTFLVCVLYAILTLTLIGQTILSIQLNGVKLTKLYNFCKKVING